VDPGTRSLSLFYCRDWFLISYKNFLIKQKGLPPLFFFSCSIGQTNTGVVQV